MNTIELLLVGFFFVHNMNGFSSYRCSVVVSAVARKKGDCFRFLRTPVCRNIHSNMFLAILACARFIIVETAIVDVKL